MSEIMEKWDFSQNFKFLEKFITQKVNGVKQ